MLVGVRREIVPIGDELRALAWLGVMLIATGAGIVVKKHFNDIGPLTIVLLLAAAAAVCYVFAARRRSSIRDYIVLLGALLISTDVGFIESQWHLLGSEWQHHFLLLAFAHAAAAYYFGNRAVLALSIAALVTWFGIEKFAIFSGLTGFALRAFICAAILLAWRFANRRPDFTSLFEHWAANIAFWGALSMTIEEPTRILGLLVTLILAAGSMTYGIRQRRELFVMYAGVYALIAIDIVIVDLLHEPILAAFWILISSIAAIAALFVIHARFNAKRLANA